MELMGITHAWNRESKPTRTIKRDAADMVIAIGGGKEQSEEIAIDVKLAQAGGSPDIMALARQ